MNKILLTYKCKVRNQLTLITQKTTNTESNVVPMLARMLVLFSVKQLRKVKTIHGVVLEAV